MTERSWNAVVLAASRGASDPIAQHYRILHKCLLQVSGQPMLKRVIDALEISGKINRIAVSVESKSIIQGALGTSIDQIEHLMPDRSAPASAIAAIKHMGAYPILVTTGDHALLTPEMVRSVCDMSLKLTSDVTVSLATRMTIASAYPQTKRTYFRFRDHDVSGCNLFTIHNERGLKLFALWSNLESNRKKPWKLALAFGLIPLARFITRRMTLSEAFQTVSTRAGATIRPLLLPYAEASIDVDKPADKDLAEQILAQRNPALQ